MNFDPQSQAGQDLFVHALLPKTEGTFLDVGCADPKSINNTWALEQLGWSGILIDGSINAVEACRAQRRNPAVCDDATTCDWTALIATHKPSLTSPIDYLSLDIDEATHRALLNLIKHRLRFRVITIEHDAYSRGDRLRIPNRALLKSEGYELIAADVKSLGCPFEDWFVCFELIEKANRFRSQGLDWSDVLKQGGVL